MVTAPARRTLVRDMSEHGLSERRALAVVRMSASSLRYTPAPDRNQALRARIVALAHRYRRYGAGMVYLKLRQAGERVPYVVETEPRDISHFDQFVEHPAAKIVSAHRTAVPGGEHELDHFRSALPSRNRLSHGR